MAEFAVAQLKASPVSVTQAPAPVLRRKCACGGSPDLSGECKECQENSLQRKAANAAAPLQPGSGFELPRGAGRPLHGATRSFMEQRFGHDFGHVRVHADSSAAESAGNVQALAYTVGHNVVFGAGQYAPETEAGRRLIAHELTHVLQQSTAGPAVQHRLEIGSPNDHAEFEADRIASQVMDSSGPASPVHVAQAPPMVRRQQGPQARGGDARRATLDQPNRGEDQVRVHVFRYLCDCVGKNVTKSSFKPHLKPNPGVTYEFCNGRLTARVTGEVIPKSFSTGTVTLNTDINVAPEGSSPGVRVQVGGLARNTGQEPEVGGTGKARIKLPGGQEATLGADVTVGTQSGKVTTEAGAGLKLGNTTVQATVTNPQDTNRQFNFQLNVPLGGPSVENQICRVCNCPVAYECLEDIPPRDYEEKEKFNVTDRKRLRYYFRLNSDQDARDPGLRGESKKTLDETATLTKEGWSVAAINGFASPEADEKKLNQPLSESRGKRLHDLVAAKLGPEANVPVSEGRGELLGRLPTITPGSALSDAIFEAGFAGPEQVTDFLIGEEIANDKLAEQFLGLLNRVTEPADRLRLFGVTEDSPVAPQLLGAIQVFIAGRGKGVRPWERIFEFLRFAAVDLTKTHEETRSEMKSTSGSIREIGETPCKRFAQDAESQNLFGAAEKEPTEANCPTGTARNPERFAEKCKYD